MQLLPGVEGHWNDGGERVWDLQITLQQHVKFHVSSWIYSSGPQYESPQFLYIVPPILVCRKKPNLIVHLDVTPEESKRRIEMRKRECESSISLDYLSRLHGAYEDFVEDIARIIPVIRVNYEKFRTADEMAEMIVRWGYYSLNFSICTRARFHFADYILDLYLFREYGKMTSVRYVDFESPERSKSYSKGSIRSQPELVRWSHTHHHCTYTQWTKVGLSSCFTDFFF